MKYKKIISISASISFISELYLTNRAIKMSHLGYLVSKSLLDIAFLVPIIITQNKVSNIRYILLEDKKNLIHLTLGMVVPTLTGEFCALKMFEKHTTLPAAIFASYPLLEALVYNLKPRLGYYISANGVSVIEKLHITPSKAVINLGLCALYGASISLMFLDLKKTDTFNADIASAAISASIAMLGMVVTGYSGNKIAEKIDPLAMTFLAVVCTVPIRIAATIIRYTAFYTSSCHDDFAGNAVNLCKVLGLATLNLFGVLAINYAYSSLSISDARFVTAITDNACFTLLEKKINIHNFTSYVSIGILFSIASCISMVINNYTHQDKQFLDTVLQVLNVENRSEATKSILAEWTSNKKFYKHINPRDQDLQTINYNEVG